MSNELNDFLLSYVKGENLQPLLAKFKPVTIKKGKHLLRPGQDCNYLAFVQSGCYRVYHFDLKGKEIVTWFSFPEMVVTDLLGFYTTGKASFYVEALEDSVIYKVTRQDLEKLYRQYPAYESFGRKFAEEALTMLMQRTMSLHTRSAEERYLELWKNPDYANKISLKHIASYLGINDTSLSRIRKNIR